MRGGGKLLTSRAAVVVVLVASRVSTWGSGEGYWDGTIPPIEGFKGKRLTLFSAQKINR